MKMICIAILIVAAILIIGATPISIPGYYPIIRYVDKEAGIACYVLRNGNDMQCFHIGVENASDLISKEIP